MIAAGLAAAGAAAGDTTLTLTSGASLTAGYRYLVINLLLGATDIAVASLKVDGGAAGNDLPILVLTARDRRPWVRGRIAGDALDAATLLAGAPRASPFGFVTALASVAALGLVTQPAHRLTEIHDRKLARLLAAAATDQRAVSLRTAHLGAPATGPRR